MKRVMIICLLFPGLVLAEGPDFARRTIDLKLQKYEEKLVACERVESNRYSPGDDALDVLRRYDDDDVRRFLVSKSSISLLNCTMPEIGDASFIVGAILESRDVSEATKTYAADKQFLLHVSSWGFYEHLNNLPPDMLAELANYHYFDEPFDALKILDELGVF